MKKLIVVLISILLLVIDNSVMPFLSIYGGFPSLLFTFAVLYSLINGVEDAVFIGVVSGILQDIYFANGVGINAIVNMFICILAAYIGNGVFKKRKLVPVATVFGATIVKHLVVLAILYFLNYKVNLNNILIVAIYNSVIAFIVYKYVLMFSNTEDVNNKWRFK
ncbi:rod shape-determining protein MreD [Clostridium sardiniense]|uniref:Rod shape-determining protein MreD n=1 Tax=Clostridium sardiniense TaxID=29369 RepID=A0ABS7KYE3_CLOSR|nr:rod shape-determining protein MreD [Clostridium sardiniense]MBY0755829.1 rod shape-determining protein MreD [Clostridium sardiniense]MDQ0459943.1 rod shape-determining protein MreD [Clostridium sardiniense]